MIQNRRDLGGIVTTDGRMIRSGMLVRSAHLFQAEAADLAGITEVIDLRTPAERSQAPDRTFAADYVHLPIFDDLRAGISREKGFEVQLLPNMALLYRRMMDECADSYRDVLRRIFRHDYARGAVLWHCTEGKDRCGMTSALVLEALGVDRETILRDYLKTNEVNLPKAIMMRERFRASHGDTAAGNVYQAYIADESYLQAAWEVMGSGYLTERLHLQEEELEAFRDTVLTGA